MASKYTDRTGQDEREVDNQNDDLMVGGVVYLREYMYLELGRLGLRNRRTDSMALLDCDWTGSGARFGPLGGLVGRAVSRLTELLVIASATIIINNQPRILVNLIVSLNTYIIIVHHRKRTCIYSIKPTIPCATKRH